MAGARALADHAYDILAAGVSPELVTTTAGRSRRVFYDHFDDKDDYLRALFAAVYDTTLHRLVTVTPTEDVVGLLRLSEGDLFDAIQRLAALGFEAVLGSEADRLQIIGWAMARDDTQIEAMVRRYYHDVDASTTKIVDALLGGRDLELRAPWTPDRIAAVLHALADGLYMRAGVDPDLADLDLFELTCLTLIPTLTTAASQEPADIRSHLDEFASTAAEVWRYRTDTPVEERGYERVIAGVLDHLADGGFGSLSLGAIARRCRLPPALVERNFPTVTALLRAVVDQRMPTLQSEVEFDLADPDISGRDALRRHLQRVGAWVQANADLALAVLACGASDPHDTERTALTLDMVAELSAPAAAVLTAAVIRGEVRADAPIADIASMTTELMLSRGTTMPGFSVQTTAAFIEAMVFDGAATPGTTDAT